MQYDSARHCGISVWQCGSACVAVQKCAGVHMLVSICWCPVLVLVLVPVLVLVLVLDQCQCTRSSTRSRSRSSTCTRSSTSTSTSVQCWCPYVLVHMCWCWCLSICWSICAGQYAGVHVLVSICAVHMLVSIVRYNMLVSSSACVQQCMCCCSAATMVQHGAAMGQTIAPYYIIYRLWRPDCPLLHHFAHNMFIHTQYKPSPSCNPSIAPSFIIYYGLCVEATQPSSACTTLLTIYIHLLWPALFCNPSHCVLI
jgi:hypothetical protein